MGRDLRVVRRLHLGARRHRRCRGGRIFRRDRVRYALPKCRDFPAPALLPFLVRGPSPGGPRILPVGLPMRRQSAPGSAPAAARAHRRARSAEHTCPHPRHRPNRPSTRPAPRRRSWTRPAIPAHASTRWARFERVHHEGSGVKTRAFTVSLATIYLVAAAAAGDDVAGSVQRVFVRIRRIRGIVDTLWAAYKTEWVAHVTEWAGYETEWAGYETEWAARETEWVAHVTEWVAHVTEWAAHLTEWAAHVTEWAAGERRGTPRGFRICRRPASLVYLPLGIGRAGAAGIGCSGEAGMRRTRQVAGHGGFAIEWMLGGRTGGGDTAVHGLAGGARRVRSMTRSRRSCRDRLASDRGRR